MDKGVNFSLFKNKKIEEYWSWFAVAIFILITIDTITTIYAVKLYGIDSEINPIMKTLLQEGMIILTIVNLTVVISSTLMFYVLIGSLKQTGEKYRKYFELLIETWLGFILFIGLMVFANNLFVIFFKTSLIEIIVSL